MLSRRKFLSRLAVALGAAPVVLATACQPQAAATPAATKAADATKAAATAATTPAAAGTQAAGTPAAAATSGPIVMATKAAPLSDYPAGKPITVYIGSTAGGGLDVACRTLQPYLEAQLNTKIVVNNMPASGGQVMFSQVAKAKPDGYTLVMINPPSANGIWLDSRRQPDFNRKSFVLIANQVWDPGVVVVKTDARWKTMADLIKEGKDKPGTIAFTMSTLGGDDHLFSLDIMAKTGADFKIINNDGGNPAIAQFIGGHADVLVCNESETANIVKKGDGKIIGMAHPQRTKYNPDAPTMKEQGLDLISYSMRGYGAPAGLPQRIHDYLVEVFKIAIAHPEHLAKMEKLNYPVQYLGPKEWTDATIAEDEKTAKLAKQFGLFEPMPISQ